MDIARKFWCVAVICGIFLSSHGVLGLEQRRRVVGIEGVNWLLARLNGREIKVGDGGREAYLRLDRTTGGMGMSVGCNNIGGEYELKGRRLRIKPGVMTRMFCEELNQLEQEYIAAMEGVSSWRVVEGHLELLSGERVVAEFVRGKGRK